MGTRTTTGKGPSQTTASSAAPRRTAAPHDSYPIKTVSRLTGLSSDVIRAWEKRYAVVAPLRGPRGARLYSSGDVSRLRLLGSLVSSGRSIGDVAALRPDELEILARNETRAADARGTTSHPRVDEVISALRRLDAVDVEKLLGESLLAVGAASFVAEIGAPLLERIGVLWESGELSIAEEHMATATIRSLFGALIRLHMPARPPTFLFTTPSGERHELGISMVTLLCLHSGMSAVYAGADLPAEDIVSAARRTKVSVVGLSVISSANRARVVEELRQIEAGLPGDVEIWLGGRDADKVASRLSGSRVLVLQSLPAIEKEIGRVARRESDSIARRGA